MLGTLSRLGPGLGDPAQVRGAAPPAALQSPLWNGHVIYNGDMTPKVGVEVAPQNGNGSAEPPKEESEGEAGGADTIEPAPAAADGGDPKTEGAAAPKDAPKKKKKFSFKKSFKLSGISFRKNKKEAGDSSGSSPTEEQGRSEETPPGGLQPSAPPEEEQSGPGEGGEGPEPKDGGEAAGSQEEENQQQQGGESQGDTAKPEEPSKGAGPEPTTSPAEQKEE
uniref:MARCKS like 1 n=1 Tax=Cyanistes caeruleus TaxID=156563 RepID=A0A8C0V8S5_CYACU